MTLPPALRFAPALSLAVAVAGCQSESKTFPVMSIGQYEALSPSARPTMFRDPDPSLATPTTSTKRTA